jgi:CDP-diacylglycerol--serine O-phosphatidyltransferase
VKKGIYLLPNGITLCGMSCGFYSLIATLRGDFNDAGWLILVANIFDMLDGWIARVTNSASRFGVELDSLSDLLAFGLAPAMLVYNWQLHLLGRVGGAIALFFALCAALRLGRYNVQVDSVESRSFTGLPTPAAATIAASGALMCLKEGLNFEHLVWLVMVLMFLLGILMVSNVRYLAAKTLLMRKRKPFGVLVVVAAVMILIWANPPMMLFACGLLYLASGLIMELYFRVTQRPPFKAVEGGGRGGAQAPPPRSP